MDTFFKKAAELANGVLDLASFIGSRMEGKRNLAKTEDMVGLTAEVTTPIGKGSVGEVVLVVNECRLNYAARCEDPDTEFTKGEFAIITKAGTSVLFVDKSKKQIVEA